MQTRRWRLVAIPIACCALSVAGAARAGDGIREVVVYGINEFGYAPLCGNDPSMTHTYHTQTAAAFRSTFESLEFIGQWDSELTANNSNGRATRWTDASKSLPYPCSGCTANDDGTYGVDSADVAFIHTHGGHYRSGSVNQSWLVMGDTDHGCYAYTDQQLKLGNTDLNVAVVKACQSGDYGVWQHGGYDAMVANSGEFTVWNAFHGNSSCDSDTVDYVGDYSSESTSDGVGENWLDEAYDSWGDDDCPVSIVYGSDSSARSHMYHWGGWLDLEDTGSKAYSTYFYVLGCYPDGGTELPS